jgi:hypothetical protein
MSAAFTDHARRLYERLLAGLVAEGAGDRAATRLLVTSRAALALQPDAVAAVNAESLSSSTAVSDLRARTAVAWIKEAPHA